MMFLSQNGHKAAQHNKNEGTLGNAKVPKWNNEVVTALLGLGTKIAPKVRVMCLDITFPLTPTVCA